MGLFLLTLPLSPSESNQLPNSVTFLINDSWTHLFFSFQIPDPSHCYFFPGLTAPFLVSGLSQVSSLPNMIRTTPKYKSEDTLVAQWIRICRPVQQSRLIPHPRKILHALEHFCLAHPSYYWACAPGPLFASATETYALLQSITCFTEAHVPERLYST